MRKAIVAFIAFIILCGVALAFYAPDTMSMAFIAAMILIIIMGVAFCVVPVLEYGRGLQRSLDEIERAQEAKNSTAWSILAEEEDLFRQRTLNELYRSYREKLAEQQRTGQILDDIDEYINEDILALHSWQNLVTQIPGTLTSIGILGTFIGLLMGIRGVGFSSASAALSSVQTLLQGVQIAFYTSIAGVILSLLFNMIYRLAWNSMLRGLGIFLDEFHKTVVPPVADQTRYREQERVAQITQLLERLPKIPAYSASSPSSAGSLGNTVENESVLMPQIMSALQKGEFGFQLQPRFDLNTRIIVGAEALVRWNHGKLGTVSPAVFLPVLENNGYITKLDQFIWESVCATVRRWIDAGLRPVPISVNVTKTDILATDVAATFEDLLKKYRIPPRSIEIEITQNAYTQAQDVTLGVEEKLRHSGFRVVVDGFNGDLLALSAMEGAKADALKLDLRRYEGSCDSLFEQARRLHLNVLAEGIENMEQLNLLRRSGCMEGQGYFLSKPVTAEAFEQLMSGERAE